jgi:hypothetical protein
MKNERTLSFQMAQKISMQDMQQVSAAGSVTNTLTGTVSGGQGWDYTLDATWDM